MGKVIGLLKSILSTNVVKESSHSDVSGQSGYLWSIKYEVDIVLRGPNLFSKYFFLEFDLFMVTFQGQTFFERLSKKVLTSGTPPQVRKMNHFQKGDIEISDLKCWVFTVFYDMKWHEMTGYEAFLCE